MILFEQARRFVYQNARPLDMARWKFYFEGGSQADVLNILAAYQNADGGFGYALEPDNWNPNSTPIATWYAAKILMEIGFRDASHPIVKGMLRYLDSGKDFVEGKWCNTVPVNNVYPHAVWWHCDNDLGMPDDNPTVTLCGFIMLFSEPTSSIYKKACGIVQKAVRRFMNVDRMEMHTINNYLGLLDYCEKIADFDQFDLNAFKVKLYKTVAETVCMESDKWYTEYVAKPSFFFDMSNRLFEILPLDLCRAEAAMIREHQSEDGSWQVTWQWHNDYKEYEISANWWRAALCVKNLKYIYSCAGKV